MTVQLGQENTENLDSISPEIDAGNGPAIDQCIGLADAGDRLTQDACDVEKSLDESEPTGGLMSSDQPEHHRETSLLQEIIALRKDFEGKLKYDLHKNGIIDKLHEELQTYRNDLVGKLLRPMIMDVILAADNVRKLHNVYQKKSPDQLDPIKLLNLYGTFSEDLENLLFRQGVDGFETDLTCGPQVFDAKRHRVIKKQTTLREEDDRTLIESLAKGYEWQGTILRPEHVIVNVYQPSVDGTTPAEVEEKAP